MSDTPKARPGGQGEYSLQGRVAVISGGSSGIGAATARRLADAGAIVWVGYNTGADRAAALVASLPGKGHQVLHLPMTNSAAIAAAAAKVGAAHGKVDILINSAAVTRAVKHDDLDGLDDALVVGGRGEKGEFGADCAGLFHQLLGGGGIIGITLDVGRIAENRWCADDIDLLAIAAQP